MVFLNADEIMTLADELTDPAGEMRGQLVDLSRRKLISQHEVETTEQCTTQTVS